MKKTVLKNHKRHDIVNLLKNNNNVGIELGVAQGTLALRLISSGKFSRLYGVDSYEDHHNIDEYKLALRNIGHTTNYKLYRMRFDQALDLFEDEYFDFVYVDGYAGNGELGGQTIHDWFAKVKLGGIIAGDDYDPNTWPLVVQAVDHFCEVNNFELLITDTVEPDVAFCKHPTWAVVKTHENQAQVKLELLEQAIKYDLIRRKKREQKLSKRAKKSTD